VIADSLARLTERGTEAAEYYFQRLATISPETSALIPLELTAHRRHLLSALTKVMLALRAGSGADDVLAALGRENRKFGVTDRHYDSYLTALLETARHFDPDGWSPPVEDAWQRALRYIGATMRAAAAADAKTAPPWWTAEIASHDLRAPGVAVLRLAPAEPLPYRPGQYVWVQVTRWPRVWRRYSAATAPRPSGLIELHVRAVPGGLVSNTLVHHSAVGDTVILGPADGQMTLADSGRDLLCVAGGTGLAPIKAIIEQAIAAAPGTPARKITLFYGAGQQFDLYDLADLELLESAYPALRVVPVLSAEPGFGGLTGLLPDVVHAQGISMFSNCEAYICGPPMMVSRTAAVLAASIPAGQIHHDPLPRGTPKPG